MQRHFLNYSFYDILDVLILFSELKVTICLVDVLSAFFKYTFNIVFRVFVEKSNFFTFIKFVSHVF